MNIYSTLDQARTRRPVAGSIVVVGNFDGVHKGHQRLLEAASRLAITVHPGAQIVPLTFWPHPVRLFRPDLPPFELMPLSVRLELLRLHGADAVAALPFDQAMADLGPEAFATEVLAQGLGAVHVIVGQGFVFGKGRAGDTDVLQELGEALGFDVLVHDPVTDAHGEVISSTRIRQHLRAAEFARAKALLTRPWVLHGPVVHGDARGRTLGFPTANTDPTHPVLCPDGIYATTLWTQTHGVQEAVTYVGRRPTYEQDGTRTVETYVIGWDAHTQGPLDLYGQEVKIAFETRIRPDQAFESDQALMAQMDLDLDAARSWHRDHSL